MVQLLSIFLVSAFFCAVGLFVLARILPVDFLAAGINARSNHTTLARQLGGLALIPAAIVTLWLFQPFTGVDIKLLASLSIASLLMWAVGGLDDKFELSETTRLGSQVIAACAAYYGLGLEFRLLPDLLPHWIEGLLIVIALVAAMNITNFMDGLDLMTVAGIGVPLLGVVVTAALGLSGFTNAVIAAATAGGLLGFALFNRPPARIFLGDSGSLPLGLIVGVVCLVLARETHIIVALILPLYYVLDSTSTMVTRLLDGENILKAHSKHAYQVAKRSGWSVIKIVTYVATLNVFLVICAIAAAKVDSGWARAALLLLAIAATVRVLLDFRGKFRRK